MKVFSHLHPGYLRLDNPEIASFFVEKMRSSKVEVDGKLPTLSILADKEFADYQERVKLFESIKSAKKTHPKKGRKKRAKNNNNNDEKE